MRRTDTASRLDAYARRRAASIVAEAQVEAEALRRRAAEDAYREARTQAAQVLLGIIQDVGQLRSRLLEGVMVQARQCLRDHCAEAGFTTAWVERACQVVVDEGGTTSRVQVPRTDGELFHTLRILLDDTVVVEQADVPCLRVERGELVLEYDPEHVVFDAGIKQPAPDTQVLHDGLAAIASGYADAVVGPRLPSP
jgi:hypothetical protein